jgi:hypothetical protein
MPTVYDIITNNMESLKPHAQALAAVELSKVLSFFLSLHFQLIFHFCIPT